jgi:hypothetical protein
MLKTLPRCRRILTSWKNLPSTMLDKSLRVGENRTYFYNSKILQSREDIGSSSPEFPSPVLSNPFWGISMQKFSEETCKILLSPLNPKDVEIKPDGYLYLPEIKYRKVLNLAFKPGGWALLPRGPHYFNQDKTAVSRDYALYVGGRFVSGSSGEHDLFGLKGMSTSLEATKSNAIMRCCKDIGIASELWDPEFIIDWRIKYAKQVWCESVKQPGQKKKLWRRKDRLAFEYPFKEMQSTIN